MRFENKFNEILEAFDGTAPGLSPKQVAGIRTTSQGMTNGDNNTATFNQPKEIDGNFLPSRKQIIAQRKKKKRKSFFPRKD